jgi:hypothetical protein
MKKIVVLLMIAAQLHSGTAKAREEREHFGAAGLSTPRVYRVVNQESYHEHYEHHDRDDSLVPLLAGAVIGYAAATYNAQQPPSYQITCEPIYRVTAITIDQYGQQHQVLQQIDCR